MSNKRNLCGDDRQIILKIIIITCVYSVSRDPSFIQFYLIFASAYRFFLINLHKDAHLIIQPSNVTP